MAEAILALELPAVEVIFCGPRPHDAPHDERVRAIDLEWPEPRGWITRKKNLLADAARYENLVLLHDRYVVTPAWADALKAYGPCFAFMTFPQVYYADDGRHVPQRYPDYQLLDQRAGVVNSCNWSIYDSERVFHPLYDDFAETAFCCGGLYIAKRSLWQSVRQDEALFHCEWEDISFGLECQRRGLPHRVNRFLVAESTLPHPLLLTRLHTRHAPDRLERGRIHVQEGGAARHAFKPIVATTREQYYARIRRRFNSMPGLREAERMASELFADCRGLADCWSAVERHVRALHMETRSQLAEIAFFLCDIVYKWPAPQVQCWIRAHELSLRESASVAVYETVVGWGTGSAFRSSVREIGRDLAFVVDRSPEKWGTCVEGIAIQPPSALDYLNDRTTAVVVFSCFVDEIAAAVRARGDFAIVPADRLVAHRRFRPLVDLVAYYEEVERSYPVLFADPALEAAA